MIAGKTKREISNLAENDRISENVVRCRENFCDFSRTVLRTKNTSPGSAAKNGRRTKNGTRS
jgi:hypothetical protein